MKPSLPSEMVIFTRTFDLLTWLLPLTNHFPRAHRHTVTARLLNAAFDLRERLEEAQLRRGEERGRALAAAEDALMKLKLYLRLAHEWRWITLGQLEHAGQIVVEIGKLLGGWRKSV
jgi:hypothetical protein